MPAPVVPWAQGSRCHLSSAQAPLGLPAAPPGHQAAGRDPEVKQPPEVPPPSSTRPTAVGPGRWNPARPGTPSLARYAPGVAAQASLWMEPGKRGPRASGRARRG